MKTMEGNRTESVQSEGKERSEYGVGEETRRENYGEKENWNEYKGEKRRGEEEEKKAGTRRGEESRRRE